MKVLVRVVLIGSELFELRLQKIYFCFKVVNDISSIISEAK